MKKIFAIASFLIFFGGASYAVEYNCAFGVDVDPSKTAVEHCSKFKQTNTSSKLYRDCINRYNNYLEFYKKRPDFCRKVQEQKINIGDSFCTVKFYEDTNKRFRAECSGRNDPDKALKMIERIYPNVEAEKVIDIDKFL